MTAIALSKGKAIAFLKFNRQDDSDLTLISSSRKAIALQDRRSQYMWKIRRTVSYNVWKYFMELGVKMAIMIPPSLPSRPKPTQGEEILYKILELTLSTSAKLFTHSTLCKTRYSKAFRLI